MRKFVLVALLILFSINGAASAAEDDIFEIEAEGSYRMEDGPSNDVAKKLAFFIAKKKRWIWLEDTFHAKVLLRSMN
jgi:hypothetical protein